MISDTRPLGAMGALELVQCDHVAWHACHYVMLTAMPGHTVIPRFMARVGEFTTVSY